MRPVAIEQKSWLHRLNRTPLRDLVRGRLTARLDIAAIIAAARLPPEPAAIVRTVATLTRLTRLEKADVAAELAAHFEDGLEAGAGAAELAAAFGDAKQAARLIRRAKLRGRPIYWRLARTMLHAVQLVFALALLVYAVQAVRLYSHAPHVARNYVAEWNAASLAVPEAERAWPLYREAFLAETKPCPDFAPEDWSPRGARWAEVVGYVSENSSAVEGYRWAASLPHLGAVLTKEGDAEVEERLGWRPRAAGDEPNDPVPWLMTIEAPQFGVLREASRLLTLDARVAGAAGNAELARRDFGAALASVNHCFQMRMLIGDLTGLAVAARTSSVLGGLLHDQPALFSDAQLADFSRRLATLGGEGDLQIDLASESTYFDDMLQRVYTDDGRGGGLPTAQVLAMAGSLPVDGPAITGPAAKIAAPAFTVLLAGRRETQAKFHEVLAQARAEARVPLWERGPSGADAEMARLKSSLIDRVRYLPVLIVFPSYSRAALQTEYARQIRDATLVAIALERYRRDAGRWPASLDELTPQYLAQVPPDRYDGQPIKYRLVDGDPLLYSVGVNRVDDGGRLPAERGPREKLSVRNSRARDWQPAGEPGLPDGDWILWPPVTD